MKSFTPGRIVMCPPAYYKLPAVENPHMDMKNQPDTEKAWKQWIAIRNLYEMLGVRVFEVEPRPRLHSMVFAANGAWGVNNEGSSEIVLARFVNPTRHGEEKSFGKLLKRMDCNVFEMPDSLFFEGQGDVITTTDHYLLGTGPRTDREVSEYLKRFLRLDKSVVELELVDDMFYHLDTCLMSLRSGNALIYYPCAFSDDSLKKIRSLELREFRLTKSAAMHLVANSVFIGDTVLLNVPFDDVPDNLFDMSAEGRIIKDGDPRYEDMKRRLPAYFGVVTFLWGLGYEVIPVYTSEFYKSGAGIRCLTLFID